MNNHRQVKGVFFDLYGTLMIYGDMEQAWSTWFNALYDSLTTAISSLTREDLSGHTEGFFSRPVPDVGDERLSYYERRLRQLGQKLGGELPQEHLAEMAQRSIDAWHGHVTLDPEAPIVLMALRKVGFPTCLISNFDHPIYIHRLLELHDLRRFFDSVTISAEVGLRKPFPEIFGDALEITQLDPQDVIYVGDTDDDIQASLACGMQPVLIKRPGAPPVAASTDYKAPPGDKTEPALDPAVTTISRLADLLGLVSGSD